MKLRVLFLFASSLLFAATTSATDFTYADLVNLIQQNKITSIESLLPQLPETLRTNYALMHQSRSLQNASYQQPRVLLFGDNASLTCAFNGDPSQLGFDTFECFQFEKQSRRFDFRQIQFPTEENHLSEVLFSESGKSNDKKISCSSCHGEDLRPNWDPYSTWPGAFGESDDSLDEDAPHYADFVDSAPKHSRYKFLIPRSQSNVVPPKNFVYGEFTSRPNLRFSDFVERMNSYRAARLLESKLAEWQVLGFAVSALKCELTSDEIKKINRSLHNYESDIDLTNLFGQLHISSNEWTTRIFNDPNKDPEYEHQGGFGYQTVDTAMAIISKRAALGDKDFAFGINQLMNYVTTKQDGDSTHFYTNLFTLLPDPDYFSESYRQNVGLFCPKLGELFTEKYLNALQNSPVSIFLKKRYFFKPRNN